MAYHSSFALRSRLHAAWESYRVVSLVLLALSGYALIFPFVSPLLAKVFPSLSHCWYQVRTGQPCPFCGITRDFGRYTVGDFVQARRMNRLSLLLFFCLIGELCWRMALVLVLPHIQRLYRLIWLDTTIHLVLCMVFVFLYLA